MSQMLLKTRLLFVVKVSMNFLLIGGALMYCVLKSSQVSQTTIERSLHPQLIVPSFDFMRVRARASVRVRGWDGVGLLLINVFRCHKHSFIMR